MNVPDFLTECATRDILITVDGTDLIVRPEDISIKTVEYLKIHKAQIIQHLNKRAANLACLMQLPDKRQFWVAPDGMDFDDRGIPIIRHSVLDKLKESGSDIRTEVMRLIDGLFLLGGELRIEPETGGATPLPDTQKSRSGQMATPL